MLALNATHVAAANTNHTPEQSRYIERYIHSINTNDANLLKRLWHPSFRDCINKSTSLYFDLLQPDWMLH
ncbi:hypothetical protein VCR4J2_20009 [Vibrio coralliirubri]|nr:hypothetical protein VCR4J2_20009 [Vibrio coralliirubri]